MNESEFTSDFANSFLTWDEGEPPAPSPAPVGDGRETAKPTDPAPTGAIQQLTMGAMQGFNIMISGSSTGVGAMSAFPGMHQATLGMMQPYYQNVPAPSSTSGGSSITHSTTSNCTAINTQQQQQQPGVPQPGQAHILAPAGNMKVPQLHPLGIQSSANCPPHATSAQSTYIPLMYNPILQHTVAGTPNHHLLALVQANQQAQHLQHVQHHAQQQQQAHQQHQQIQQQQIHQAQQQALQQAHQQAQHHAQQQAQHQVQQQQQQQLQQSQQQALMQAKQQAQQQHSQQQAQQHTQTQQQQEQHVQQQQQEEQHARQQQSHQVQQPTQQQVQQQAPQVQQQTYVSAATPTPTPQQYVSAPANNTMHQHFSAAPPTPTSSHVAGQLPGSRNKPLPPFYLFDAPCELRANFIASQRMHNLPIHSDDNTFHYGMAVNGFHPQMNAQANPILPLSGTTSLPAGSVQLMDARSRKNYRSGKERNEREQKRAQKITDLIEKLRISMEGDGWKVEMKSKFHTLSTCADYVKHLVKATKEKEVAVEQAKNELEMTERKREEDNNVLERSDPESVTSSLTAMTTESKSGGKNRKRKSSNSGKKDDKSRGGGKKAAKRNNSESSEDSASENGQNEHNNISLNKMSSNMSELTDSNKGSSESGDGEKIENDNACSISSTAAVVRAKASAKRERGHADVVVKANKKGKSKPELNPESTSLDANFQLDYETVFETSNVPQLLATAAGRIVACNDFFSIATGITKEQTTRLTIFSMVQAHKLSNMFEMVAQALRDDRQQHEKERKHDGSADSSANTTSESGADSCPGRWDQSYPAITLPCVSFQSLTKPGSPNHPNPLYMTVTLLRDDDPRHRCFHCIFTDNPGTNGKMGFITPELLAMLFSGRPERIASSSSETNVSSLGSDCAEHNDSKANSSVSAEDTATTTEAERTS